MVSVEMEGIGLENWPLSRPQGLDFPKGQICFRLRDPRKPAVGVDKGVDIFISPNGQRGTDMMRQNYAWKKKESS